MLELKDHCEFLDRSIRDRIATIYSSFKLFIQLFSALIAGSVALSLTKIEVAPKVAWLAAGLAVLIGITSAIMILEAHRSWHRFRTKLFELAGKYVSDTDKAVSKPGTVFGSSTTVFTMLIVIAVAVIVFVFANPLHLSPKQGDGCQIVALRAP